MYGKAYFVQRQRIIINRVKIRIKIRINNNVFKREVYGKVAFASLLTIDLDEFIYRADIRNEREVNIKSSE